MNQLRKLALGFLMAAADWPCSLVLAFDELQSLLSAFHPSVLVEERLSGLLVQVGVVEAVRIKLAEEGAARDVEGAQPVSGLEAEGVYHAAGVNVGVSLQQRARTCG